MDSHDFYRRISRIPQRVLRLIREESETHNFWKYGAVLAVVALYFSWTVHKFGAKDGILVTALTWSFFVLCTPIADAGFLVDMPVRLLLGVKMVYSEIAVWFVAIVLNSVSIVAFSSAYENTVILKLLHHILMNPFPFWGIIFLSAIGTFFSIYIGDKVADAALSPGRKEYRTKMARYKVIILIFLVAMTITLYDFLLNKLGISIPLI